MREVKIKGILLTVLFAIPGLDLLRLNLVDIMLFVKIVIGILRIKNALCARLKLMGFSKLSKEKSDKFNFFVVGIMKRFKRRCFKQLKINLKKESIYFM